MIIICAENIQNQSQIVNKEIETKIKKLPVLSFIRFEIPGVRRLDAPWECVSIHSNLIQPI